MENKRKAEEEEITIRRLYPNLNEEQLKEAEENLKRHLELEGIRNTPEAFSAFKALTDSKQTRMINDKRSNTN